MVRLPFLFALAVYLCVAAITYTKFASSASFSTVTQTLDPSAVVNGTNVITAEQHLFRYLHQFAQNRTSARNIIPNHNHSAIITGFAQKEIY